VALAGLLGEDVGFADDCIGEPAKRAVERTASGGFCLLENLRFRAGEKANDPVFVRALSSLSPLYVNDAFGSCHRAHASVVGLPDASEIAVAGRLVQTEVAAFGDLLESRARPFIALLGGAKVSGKIDTIDALLGRIDSLLVGGGMANTFLAAAGVDMQSSLVGQDELDVARRVMARAAELGVDVVLPSDVVTTDRLEAASDDDRTIETTGVDEIRPGFSAVDLGPLSLAAFESAISSAAVVFWNGPVGVFERPPFDAGTRRLAGCLAAARAFSIAGGGETVAAIHLAGAAAGIDHISTGGGASLALVAGKTLPGLESLQRQQNEGTEGVARAALSGGAP